ncbi:hypothetical protein HBI56_025080 [Parastagonospora nodorum]|nr:hypothetical protein HBH52_011120 [Parastagonospora nodorum]KAH4006392.1 hypothetical protein HBI10_021530 [Parastagonospora nodorum]KAH4008487.1 hypothetical protein HBI13_234550 [Parastagonospora nodorum]KAH4025590.1 hypothetical protein HBI09_155380 [Parastagonospora nodorum]KAH4075213.1 hypothetical protein HBH50_035660 [Parastagonospora nodorum]
MLGVLPEASYPQITSHNLFGPIVRSVAILFPNLQCPNAPSTKMDISEPPAIFALNPSLDATMESHHAVAALNETNPAFTVQLAVEVDH